MKFEVVECAGEWIVRREGEEIARFAEQNAALNHIAHTLRDADGSQPASLAMRYQRRA